MTDTPVAAEPSPVLNAPAAPAAADPTPAAAPLGSSEPAAVSATTAAAPSSSSTTSPTEGKTESTPSLISSAEGKKGDTPEAPKEQPAPAKEPVKAEAPKEAQPAESKAPDPAKTADAIQPPAPVKYEELKVPEGVKLAEGQVKAWLDIENDSKLTPTERSQKTLDLYIAEVKRIGDEAAAHQRKAWNDTNDAWKDQTRKDPEIGGKNLEPSLAGAKAFAEEFLKTPEERSEFFHYMDHSGMGNNPIVLKLMSRAAKQFNVFENGITPGGNKPPTPPKGPGNRGWYPTMQNGAAP